MTGRKFLAIIEARHVGHLHAHEPRRRDQGGVNDALADGYRRAV